MVGSAGVHSVKSRHLMRKLAVLRERQLLLRRRWLALDVLASFLVQRLRADFESRGVDFDEHVVVYAAACSKRKVKKRSGVLS